MNNREEIKQKLKSIKSLAERGVGGEKENASLLFKQLCEKHKISDAELNEEREFWLNLGRDGEFRYVLSSLVVIKALGDIPLSVKKVGKNVKISFETTLDIFVDIKTTIDLLVRHRDEQVKLFDQAFIIKHDLAISKLNPEDLTEEQLAAFAKVYKLKDSIDKKEIYKEIENNVNNS